MPDAAARVVVGEVDELGHRVIAVAHHVPRHALGRRDQRAVDHQHAVVATGHECFDDHRAAVLARLVVGGAHRGTVAQVECDAAAVIAVVGFDHDGEAQLLRRDRGFLLGVDEALLRHRKPKVAEDAVRLFFVGGDLDGDVPRLAGDRRLDALLVLAVAELHEALVIEPDPRDVARFGSAHECSRARSQGAALREADELVARLFEHEALGDSISGSQRMGQQREQQQQPELAGLDADFRLLELEHDLVDARGSRRARLAEGDARARGVLQLDRDMLEHVAQPGALVLGQAADEAARLAVGAAVLAQARECFDQSIHERFAQLHARPLLQLAEIDDEADDGEVGVKAGAEIDGGVEQLHGVEPRGEGVKGTAHQSNGARP